MSTTENQKNMFQALSSVTLVADGVAGAAYSLTFARNVSQVLQMENLVLISRKPNTLHPITMASCNFSFGSFLASWRRRYSSFWAARSFPVRVCILFYNCN